MGRLGWTAAAGGPFDFYADRVTLGRAQLDPMKDRR